jgi:hypothetical protein
MGNSDSRGVDGWRIDVVVPVQRREGNARRVQRADRKLGLIMSRRCAQEHKEERGP